MDRDANTSMIENILGEMARTQQEMMNLIAQSQQQMTQVLTQLVEQRANNGTMTTRETKEIMEIGNIVLLRMCNGIMVQPLPSIKLTTHPQQMSKQTKNFIDKYGLIGKHWELFSRMKCHF